MTTGARQARVSSFRRTFVVLLVLAPVVWAAGFLRFVDQVPRPGPVQAAQADAVVVLTGGSGRLEAGFELLSDRRAERLFVSGVNAQVTKQQMRSRAGHTVSNTLFACCVELGHEAMDTLGNATETAAWVRKNEVRSILLVTSNYHMPRSRFELSLLLPDVVIHPFPVFAERVEMDRWWRHPETLQLLWTEFHKTLLSSLRELLS